MIFTENLIERWGIFELALTGSSDGNPFVDVDFGALFQFIHRDVKVRGFYVGNGVYRVRFMPDESQANGGLGSIFIVDPG